MRIYNFFSRSWGLVSAKLHQSFFLWQSRKISFSYCNNTTLFLKTKKINHPFHNYLSQLASQNHNFATMDSQSLQALLPANFADNSRVWIYQSNRAFIPKEQAEINEQLSQFYLQWEAHGTPVKGWASVVYGQFIIIMADESQTLVSGCSTDASVRIIKSIERQYSVNLFDRMSITFLRKNKAEMLPLGQVQYAIDQGFIDGNTLLFNNVVYTKAELLQNWLVPLSQSWLADRISLGQ